MSCSSNRKRLVGSCISTLVSRTKSLLAGTRRAAGPDLTAGGLTDLRVTRVKGAGRVLRSTMSLLDDVVGGGALTNCLTILASGPAEHKQWWTASRSCAMGCGEKGSRLRV